MELPLNEEARDPAGLRAAGGVAGTARRSLLANTFYAIAGTGFYSACQLGVLVLLAKFASPEIQGQYFLGLALATPVVLLFGFELRGAFVADAGNQFTFGAYRALRAAMLVPAAAVLAAFMVWQAATETRPAHLLILGGVFVARLVWSFAEVGWGTFQRRERLDWLATSLALRGLALLLPFALLLPLCSSFRDRGHIAPERVADGAALGVLLYALGLVLIYHFFDRPRVLDRRHWDLSWNWRSVRALAVQTLPLGLVSLIINLCDNLPRILIGSQPNGKAQLGYFGSLAYITLAGNLVTVQASAAAANRLALHYQRDLGAFLRLGARLVALAMVVGGGVLVVALLFGGWILRVLYRPEYAVFETEFHIIVVAQCLALLTNVLGAATTQMRLFWVQVPVQITTLVCTVTAAVVLIPGPTPVLGAAQTALVRATVQLTLYAVCAGLGLLLRRRILRQAGYLRERPPSAD